MGTKLLLHEEILLLALHDEKGTIISQNYPHATGGAILAELLLSGRVRVEERGRRKMLQLAANKATGDPVLDECLDKVAKAKRIADLQTWVTRFGQLKDLQHRVADGLCKQGILQAHEEPVLWVFPRTVYPEVNPGPEQELIERLRQAIFSDSDDVDPHTVVLVSLSQAAGLLRLIFGKKDLASRSDRIQQLINAELTGKAAKEAIDAMNAAVMVAVMMPLMFTSSH